MKSLKRSYWHIFCNFKKIGNLMICYAFGELAMLKSHSKIALRTIARIVSVFLILFLSILSITLETTAADDYKISNELNAYLVRSIIQTDDGYLWILSAQDILRFDGREFENVPLETDHPAYELFYPKGRSEGLTQKHLDDYGLSSDQIQAVIEDRKGSLWVGTKFGLDRLLKASNGRIHTEHYLNNVDVLSIFEDKEGSIWVGTRSSGLKCLKETVFTTHSVSNSAASNHFSSLLKDSKGRIWAGTRYGDLYWFEDGHFERIPLETDIFDNIMFIMEQDNQGRILLGTEYRGVHVYENGKTRPYMAEDGPVSGTIVTLFCDSRDRLWVGRYAKELGFYENGKYSRFLTSQEYPAKMVFSFTEDKHKNLWIGGTKGVLFLPGGRADKQNVKWLLKGIPVHSLLEDDSGMIWCGTSENGLIRIHPDSFAIAKISDDQGLKIDPVIFGVSDGLPPPGLAGLETQEGHLLFATNNGIAEVDPETVPVNRVPPSVLVQRILQNGQILEMKEATAGPLKIKSRFHLEIHFKVITFKGQENIQAKYRLTGLEKNWTSLAPEQDKAITFTDLTPGQYTLQITASNNHGIWSAEKDHLSFQVIPSFFETFYFKLVGLLFILAGAGLLTSNVMKRAQKKKNKYRKTRLPEDLAQQYQQRLLFLLEKKKIYRDSSLCIQTLSSRLSLPAHHLSQVINEKFHKNFYELINGYRLEGQTNTADRASFRGHPRIRGYSRVSNRKWNRHSRAG